MAALTLLDHGDLATSDMKGAWAGEIGQMQFVPTEYVATAVDFDGDGKRNLVRSVPDVLASSAALLKKHGWQAGQPWLEEVRVPADMPWAEADLAIKHPRSQWAAWGVKNRDGERAARRRDAGFAAASRWGGLGRRSSPIANFGVYTQWNESLVYATTAAYFATRLAGAPKVSAARAEAPSRAEIKEVQQRLKRLGYDVGGVDGIIGANTRAAVKAVQHEARPAGGFLSRPGFLAALRKM